MMNHTEGRYDAGAAARENHSDLDGEMSTSADSSHHCPLDGIPDEEHGYTSEQTHQRGPVVLRGSHGAHRHYNGQPARTGNID